MKRIAAIVIGSNSTRLLAADALDELTHAIRGRVETRLFLGMSDDRMLAPQAMLYTAQSVAALKQQALDSGAELIGIYATSASRDAKNAGELSQLIEAYAGLPLTVLSGEEEAAYSFFGAAGKERCGVIDIGGGSTEVVLGCGLDITHAYSLQLGASRLFKTHPIHRQSDVSAALLAAKEIAAALPREILLHENFDVFYLIGGTGTALASLALADPEGYRVTKESVYQNLLRIAAVPSEKRAEIPGFPAARCDILPTGMAILIAVLDALRIDCALVTKRVNADGLLRAYVHKKFA